MSSTHLLPGQPRGRAPTPDPQPPLSQIALTLPPLKCSVSPNAPVLFLRERVKGARMPAMVTCGTGGSLEASPSKGSLCL